MTRPELAPVVFAGLRVVKALRRRLRNAVLSLIGGFLIAYTFAEQILALLALPLMQAWERHRVAGSIDAPALNFGGMGDAFWAYMSQSFWVGILIASPFISYQIWALFRPAMPNRGRHLVPGLALVSGLVFIGGAAFCYFVVLPPSFDFLLGYATRDLSGLSHATGTQFALQPMLFIGDYVDLVRRLLIAFGLVFEMPVIVFALAKLGFVTHRGLLRFGRWAIVILFSIAAILTPGPDVISQLFMAVPLCILYYLSILIAWIITIRRERAADRVG